MDGTTYQEAARIKYEIYRQGRQQKTITEVYEKETIPNILRGRVRQDWMSECLSMPQLPKYRGYDSLLF